MASRTETSLARDVPRTSSSVARLLHAMARTRPTMTNTSDAIAMNGVSAWGWIRTSVEGTTGMPGPPGDSPCGRNRSRILGREPLREHVHRCLGLRQRDAVAQTGFHEKGC